MTRILYIIIAAIAFTNTFQGQSINFYLKYYVSVAWIIIALVDLARHKKYKCKLRFTLKEFCIPYLLMMFWSFVCLLYYGNFQSMYLSRMIGSILYMLITYCTAVAAVYFFGKNAIEYSLYGMLVSILVNLIVTISNYGMGNFIEYLKTFLTTVSYPRGSVLYSISGCLEVQDVTMAAGMYILYYLFFFVGDIKNKQRNLLLSMFCFILGFKRAGLVALVFTIIVYLVLFRQEKTLKIKIQFSYFAFIIIAFLYLIIIKSNVIQLWANYFSLSMNGRDNIYKVLSSYYELVPWFIGHGYSYVDKVMYESTTFVSHSIIGKMYSELGFLPFIVWSYHFVNRVTNRIERKYGKSNAIIYLTCCVYVFCTFFFENTLTLYCIQFSYLLIPLANDLKGRLNEKY